MLADNMGGQGWLCLENRAINRVILPELWATGRMQGATWRALIDLYKCVTSASALQCHGRNQPLAINFTLSPPPSPCPTSPTPAPDFIAIDIFCVNTTFSSTPGGRNMGLTWTFPKPCLCRAIRRTFSPELRARRHFQFLSYVWCYVDNLKSVESLELTPRSIDLFVVQLSGFSLKHFPFTFYWRRKDSQKDVYCVWSRSSHKYEE